MARRGRRPPAVADRSLDHCIATPHRRELAKEIIPGEFDKINGLREFISLVHDDGKIMNIGIFENQTNALAATARIVMVREQFSGWLTTSMVGRGNVPQCLGEVLRTGGDGVKLWMRFGVLILGLVVSGWSSSEK